MNSDCLSHQTLSPFSLNSEVDLGTWGEIRVRQSPDWRFAERHSGEWRSRDRRQAELNLKFQLDPHRTP